MLATTVPLHITIDHGMNFTFNGYFGMKAWNVLIFYKGISVLKFGLHIFALGKPKFWLDFLLWNPRPNYELSNLNGPIPDYNQNCERLVCVLRRSKWLILHSYVALRDNCNFTAIAFYIRNCLKSERLISCDKLLSQWPMPGGTVNHIICWVCQKKIQAFLVCCTISLTLDGHV